MELRESVSGVLSVAEGWGLDLGQNDRESQRCPLSPFWAQGQCELAAGVS